MKKFLILFIILFFSFIIYSGYNSFYKKEDLIFSYNSDTIHGKLILPKHRNKETSILIFVHGDGAMTYDSYGYYDSLWQKLAKNNIASFSWDKPGVNDSSGNWLNYSMEDRADLVIKAIKKIKTYKKFKKIGLIGYSQAGWVLPIVASKSNDIDFMIMVSGAISWIEQNDFITKNRLIREEKNLVKEAISYNHKLNELLKDNISYKDYTSFHKRNYYEENNEQSLIKEKRFDFVKRNYNYDSSKYLNDIKIPILAIFGYNDLNVNIKDSIATYKKRINKDLLTIKVFNEANHSLLKSEYFDEIKPDLWWLIKLNVLQNEAFIKDYLELIKDWVIKQ